LLEGVIHSGCTIHERSVNLGVNVPQSVNCRRFNSIRNDAR
jgi:hypothetical protein